MHRSHTNLVPVTNKYLAHKKFVKDQEEHKLNLQNIHSLLDHSSPTPRPHLTQRVRQKQNREYELEIIHNENDRLRTRMIRNGAFTNTHNNYVARSLNIKERNREESQHKNTYERLQKQIHHVKSTYSIRKSQNDYAKQQDFKRQITRFPPIKK
ncbi:unnamed protein product [Adineta steineri]|uniref:Uncharacterized protein n=1 Tax=Adineta steineri TaxID=433720 RepID=A0A814HL79_9BILA|nr:unnamed protein product [Adineta steineri]CAF3811301.1 unnamed protein product [Adineta steineri]